MSNEINKFELICYSTGQYQGQVICLSYESIHSYIHIIENELLKKNIHRANILIDQLLITGNNKNRFLSIEFDNGNLLFSTAININADDIYRQFTISHLKKRKDILTNSILTPQQISLIERGCIF